MKSDISRQTFDKHKHYNTVVLQQGRVLLDAEWNEQQAILGYYRETEAADIIGMCGAPGERAGFAITVDSNGSTLLIGPGHYYVDGILCENEGDAPIPYTQQFDLPDPPDVLGLLKSNPTELGLVYLDVWQRHLTALDDPIIREQALGYPDTTTRIRTVWQVKVLPVTLNLDLLVNELKSVQDALRNPPSPIQNPDAAKAISNLVDRINRFLTAAGDDLKSLEKVTRFLGDVAIELINLAPTVQETEPRALLEQLGWQLEGLLHGFEADLCQQPFPEWNSLLRGSSGILKARTAPAGSINDPCLLPPTAGYQRLENQLYRVEIHQGGDPSKDSVSFKWSRDNGSVVTSLAAPMNAGDTMVVVNDLGPDDELGFAITQNVELSDDKLELYGLPGQLAIITDIAHAQQKVTLDRALTGLDGKHHSKLRRWDGIGTVPTDANAWVTLEDGVEVQFSAGVYKTGDYWLIPARTASGTIEWPTAQDGTQLAQPPLGIYHHYCRLALLYTQNREIVPVHGGEAVPAHGSVSNHSFSLFADILERIGLARARLADPNIADPGVPAQDPTPGRLEALDCRTIFRPLADTPPAMHVIRTSWQNDSFVSLQRFLNEGLYIFLDDFPDPVSLIGSNSPFGGGTLLVTLEIASNVLLSPGTNLPNIDQRLPTLSLLTGTIQTFSNVIHWKLNLVEDEIGNLPAGLFLEMLTPLVRARIPIRVRVVLKGHCIWNRDTLFDRAEVATTSRHYLDGQAFGRPMIVEQHPRIDLVLPSGAGTRASDFESWFYLGIGPSNIFQVRSVNFISAPAGARERVIRTVNTTDTGQQFGDTDRLNAIDVIFNRPVSPEGLRPGDPQKGIFVEIIAGTGVTSTISGTLDVKGSVVRFTAADQRLFPFGSLMLVVQSMGTAGPLIKAADDNTPLSGDFKVPFTIG